MAWIEAGLYSSVSLVQILNGNYHNRALCKLYLTCGSKHSSKKTKHGTKIDVRNGSCERSMQYGLDVAQAHHQLVSLVNTLEVAEKMEDFDQKNDKCPNGLICT